MKARSTTGVLALGGRIPLGYYKDEAKTAATFRTIDGARYSVPGDYAEVDEDGTIHLLGRGSVCINTGGEKVYPEEVEEVGEDHPRGGRRGGGRASRTSGSARRSWPSWRPRPACRAGGLDPDLVIEHVKSKLASLQGAAPGPPGGTIGRSPAGKVDYARHRAETAEWAGVSPG